MFGSRVRPMCVWSELLCGIFALKARFGNTRNRLILCYDRLGEGGLCNEVVKTRPFAKKSFFQHSRPEDWDEKSMLLFDFIVVETRRPSGRDRDVEMSCLGGNPPKRRYRG